MLPFDPFIIPVLLYAETHFRFFGILPSLLYRNNPEVLFDLPRRIGPGSDLPVLLLCNDIDRFPAQCAEVTIAVTQNGEPARRFGFESLDKYIVEHPFSFQSAVYLFTIPRIELKTGTAFITCTATMKRGKKTNTIINDNLPGSSKLSFSCFISDEPLPGHEYCSLGDMHVHSHYSQSHVEFGPPIEIIDLLSKCYGIDFVVITDHSYDLACSMTDYLKPDCRLPRWDSIFKDVSNKKFNTIVVLGEEISCLNSKGKAVHLCGIGIQKYISGTMDGARRTAMDKQLSIAEVISELHSQQGVAFAAHPGSKMGIFQRLFLKRGNWEQRDCSFPLDGIQGINNGFGKNWAKAKSLWIKELKKGHKLSLAAGNDCHGDFNRYRYLAVPFVSIGESFHRYFSNAMTGIYQNISSQQDVIQGLKKGKTFVTTGPYLCIGASTSPFESIVSNEEYDLTNKELSIAIISSPEFGLPYCIRLFYGDMRQNPETMIFCKYFNKKHYTVIENLPGLKVADRGYVRAEAECLKEDGRLSFSATSPCYFSK